MMLQIVEQLGSGMPAKRNYRGAIFSDWKLNKLKSLKVAQVKDEMDDDESDGCDSVCDVVTAGAAVSFPGKSQFTDFCAQIRRRW